jgi:hypothetical protein
MKRKKLAVGTLVGVLVLLATTPAWAALQQAAYWPMKETSGPMLDASGNGNNGVPSNLQDRTGTTYVFDGSTSHVIVPDDYSLDPRANDITLKARVKVNGTSLDDDSYDVVRKGFVTTSGGDYKLEIIRKSGDPTVGKLHCLFKGSGGTVDRVASPDVVDGAWHTLTCAKTSGSVVAKVGKRSFATSGSAGSISNSSNVMVGGKTVDPRPDDMFDGEMDYVGIDIAR